MTPGELKHFPLAQRDTASRGSPATDPGREPIPLSRHRIRTCRHAPRDIPNLRSCRRGDSSISATRFRSRGRSRWRRESLGQSYPSGSGTKCSPSHSAMRSSCHSPAAIANTTCSASSTDGRSAHDQPSMSTNTRSATHATRLFPVRQGGSSPAARSTPQPSARSRGGTRSHRTPRPARIARNRPGPGSRRGFQLECSDAKSRGRSGHSRGHHACVQALRPGPRFSAGIAVNPRC